MKSDAAVRHLVEVVSATYVGIADAHGVESFHIAHDVTPGTVFAMRTRVNANRHRHAVFYAVTLDQAGSIAVRELLKEGETEMALTTIKAMATDVIVDAHGDAEASWRQIPNPALDPYGARDRGADDGNDQERTP